MEEKYVAGVKGKRKREEKEKEKEKEVEDMSEDEENEEVEEGEDKEEEKEKVKESKPTSAKKRKVVWKETFTITFGDSAENHVGMQKLGTIADKGFDLEDLNNAKAWFEARGIEVKIHHLNEALPASLREESEPAYVLIAKNAVSAIANSDDFHAEQAALPKDTKALMYGRVVNKHARHNLCFADEGQEPNYGIGKGRVVAFGDTPLLKKVRETLPEVFGASKAKAEGLFAEGNYYYDIAKCGIGFHGDAERKKVVAVRTGASIPLHYQWFHRGKPVGERIELMPNHGDMYVMSDKATGNDWKKKTVCTLRHAAGAKKFLTITDKSKKKK